MTVVQERKVWSARRGEMGWANGKVGSCFLFKLLFKSCTVYLEEAVTVGLVANVRARYSIRIEETGRSQTGELFIYIGGSKCHE